VLFDFAIIILITYLVGLAEFNHIVAGSTTTLFLVANGSIRLPNYLTQFFLPTLFGNIIGGVSLVAAGGPSRVLPR
jgi:formate/nitrite transporter FocA (FNT family)